MDEMTSFWSQVKIPIDPDSCWEWTGNLFSCGYGSFWRHGHRNVAHRVSYQLLHGPIPTGLLVCHHCDNRKCVSPHHLFLGDYRANNIDCNTKGRRNQSFGEHRYCAKLTEGKVRTIRSKFRDLSGERGSKTRLMEELSRSFGVRPITIYEAAMGRKWKHVQ